MAIETGPQNFRDIMANKKNIRRTVERRKDLALRIIDELNIQTKKRNAVFLVCKQHSKNFIEKCLNDTKELAKTGESWRYFFKLVEKNQTNLRLATK